MTLLFSVPRGLAAFMISSSTTRSTRTRLFRPGPACISRITASMGTTSSSLQGINTQHVPVLDVENLQEVTSTKSKTVKLYQTLSSKSKARIQHQMTILEGHRLVIDTISNEKDGTKSIFQDVLVTREALNHPQLGEKLSQQLGKLSNNGCNVRLAGDNVIKAVCDTVTPQGVVAVVKLPPSYSNKNEGSNVSMHKKHKLYILFDGISDPGNVGTLLRSSFSVGAEAVILLPNSCDVWNPKAIRSAMGTSFQVPIRSVSSWDECLAFMESCGVSGEHIYAATMEGSEKGSTGTDGNNGKLEFESKPHDAINWTSGSNALILGREGTGLSTEIRRAVANGQIRSVHVPMEPGIESLNAAVCGSVIMFEYHRQSRAAVVAGSLANDT